ncbi:Uncharacterised protein [Moraxella caviae]|uniref:Uncharacterized protein n=1 Tax=Moraxella caviae TaxID=34060 RepID=A0A378RAB4_9GAMM|nr:Uncharacterised protein [Moraxella caviae]VEW10493.1 Uncharacterised protein [Moraxella caviae]
MLTPDTFHQILQESEILSDLFFHQVLQESEIVLGWMGLGFQPGFENSPKFQPASRRHKPSSNHPKISTKKRQPSHRFCF